MVKSVDSQLWLVWLDWLDHHSVDRRLLVRFLVRAQKKKKGWTLSSNPVLFTRLIYLASPGFIFFIFNMERILVVPGRRVKIRYACEAWKLGPGTPQALGCIFPIYTLWNTGQQFQRTSKSIYYIENKSPTHEVKCKQLVAELHDPLGKQNDRFLYVYVTYT